MMIHVFSEKDWSIAVCENVQDAMMVANEISFHAASVEASLDIKWVNYESLDKEVFIGESRIRIAEWALEKIRARLEKQAADEGVEFRVEDY
jgi:hypothetical protein